MSFIEYCTEVEKLNNCLDRVVVSVVYLHDGELCSCPHQHHERVLHCILLVQEKITMQNSKYGSY